jgi:CBS domain-containing protein
VKVSEAMTRDVHACRPEATAHDALEAMWHRDIGAMPVVDPQGKVEGMITDRDIAMATWMRRCAPEEVPVRKIMSREVWFVGPDDDITAAEQVMERHQVRRLPVVADGRVVGVVTLADLVRVRQAVPPADVVQTLSRITEPRHEASAS